MAVDEEYRLPRHARPVRYDLVLTPDLDAARFDGRVGVELEVLEPTDRLVLHALELDISSARLSTPSGTELAATVTLDEPNQMATLALPERLAPDAGYRLAIDFTGTLNDQLRGFYRSTFSDDDGHERVIATTQFESSDARRAFPCWDEPEFKAVFQITLVVEDGLTAISNEGVESVIRRPDGRTEVRFAETMVMSTYLVACVVGPYELTEPVEVDGVPLRVAAVPGKQSLTPFAMDVAEHSLRFLGGYFGIPYPGGKLDHVAVPDFAFGAMENLGCVTYRENLLLTDPDTAAQTELQRIASVVAHETAHMWFGDLVTMKWWNGIWLNEAFATFMELTTSDDYRPEWQMWTAFGAGKAAALGTDGLQATRPVEFPVGRPEEADAMFDVLTYQKGGSVLKMLEQYLGPEGFRRGISHYLSTHAHGNTETEDLWEALETTSGEPVRSMMNSWILQGGYPIVHAEIGDDPSTVVLRQRRFVYSGSEGSERWVVPINLRASVKSVVQQERVLLDGEQTSFTFPGPIEWLVVNDGAWGFYRTRYSPDLWARLAAADPATVLCPLERLQLVGDTWAAVVSGEAELAEWAEVALAVAAEPDPDVWASLAGVLNLLDLSADDADRAAIERFARRLAGPAWTAAGWHARPDESDRVAIARGRILSVLVDYGHDADLAAEARRRLGEHLGAGSGTVLSPDLIGPAARITVSTGGPEGWAQVHDAHAAAEQAQEKLRFLYALAETRSDDLRQRTLDMAIGAEVRSQDGPFLISAMLNKRGSGPDTWAYLEQHWDRVVNRFPPALLPRTVEAVTAIVDPEVAARVRSFFDSTDTPIAPIRVAQILERMDINVALAARLRGTMATALEGIG